MKKSEYLGNRPEKKAVVEEKAATVTINLVKVQSLMDARMTYTGQASGKSYEWARAGAIVDVDEQDVSELLAKRRGKKSCCGTPEQKVFQLAQ
jgi:hypothetical protein